jgi:hypothetical protein
MNFKSREVLIYPLDQARVLDSRVKTDNRLELREYSASSAITGFM